MLGGVPVAHVGWSSVLTRTVAHWAALFVPPPPFALSMVQGRSLTQTEFELYLGLCVPRAPGERAPGARASVGVVPSAAGTRC